MRKCRLILFAIFLLAAVAAAQDSASKRFTMLKIVFKGSRVYNDQQLLSALGMKVGGSYTQQDLQDFANKLNATGMFSQVVYRFTPYDAEYDLKDADTLLPVKFQNCIWIDDNTLMEELKRRVPLFIGVVPQDGIMPEEVENKMEGILADRGVKAKVQFVPSFDAHNKLQAMAYSVIDPRIEIADMKLLDVSSDLAEPMAAAARKTVGREYSHDAMDSIVNATLLPVLQEKGYLRGYFSAANVKLVTAPADNPAKVEVTVPVHEGAQYKITGFTMKSDDPIAKEAGKQLSTFKTGDVANMVALKQQFSTLGAPYLAKGYMAAKVKAEPTYDDAAHTVAFTIEFNPGEQYKLGKLNVQGLDDATTEKVMKVWTMKVGDIYDATYARNFLRNNEMKLAFLNGYSLGWTQRIHDDEKTVELSIFFRR